MRTTLWIRFILILILVGIAGYIAWPQTDLIKIGSFRRDVSVRQGLDLKGGASLVYTAESTDEKSPEEVKNSMEGVREVIESRINGLGVVEPEIRLSQIGETPAIIIDLPGVTDIENAKKTIGSTAKLTFRNEAGDIVLEGKDLRPQGAQANTLQAGTQQNIQSTNDWQVNLELTSEGKDKFAKATSENLNKQIGIYLDETLVSAPTVNTPITDGQAVITGNFTADQAKNFALQLNYGALPVNIKLEQEQTVGASLGASAVSSALIAGTVGIGLVFFFIIAFYGFTGLIAVLSLFIYILLNIALYKFIPVTMTLAGIAGFIISIGIAIDTNILTFERLKEELRLQKPLPVAIQESFKRSWTSIRDSHISGLISATIIFIFTTGPVRGFAVVLLLGTLLSLFTAITVTRTFLLLLSGTRLGNLINKIS